MSSGKQNKKLKKELKKHIKVESGIEWPRANFIFATGSADFLKDDCKDRRYSAVLEK